MSLFVVLCGAAFVDSTAPPVSANMDSFPVYIGAGGCDVTDSACPVPTPTELQQFRQYLYSSAGGAGSLKLVKEYNVGGIPSWLESTEKCLFATQTNANHVLSYSKDAITGALTLKSNATSGSGFNPVFLSTIADSIVLAANYHGPDDGTNSTGAGVTSFLLDDTCQLKLGDFYPTTGSSVNPERQGASHIHSVVPFNQDKSEDRLFFACDLGADLIYTFTVNRLTGHLQTLHRFSTSPGSGPRHIAVHPTLPIIYVVHEMMNFVTALAVADDGSLTHVSQFALLPDNFQGFSKSAEIVISADGDFLFATTRGFGDGTNTVVMFTVDSKGQLILKERAWSGTSFPRGMELPPDNSVLFVGGQSTQNIVSFGFRNGLKLTGMNVTNVPTPTTFAF